MWKHVTSYEGKKWTLGLKIIISREYPTISGDNERQEEIIGFTSSFNICLRINSDFVSAYSNSRQKITNDFLSWLRDGSSWQFERTEELTVSIASYNPLSSGGSWFPLPKHISQRRKAILNINKNIAEGTRGPFYTIGRSSLPAAETLRRRRRRRRTKHDS